MKFWGKFHMETNFSRGIGANSRIYIYDKHKIPKSKPHLGVYMHKYDFPNNVLN